jgi:hypothetical protein
MTKVIEAGTDYTYKVDFIVDGELVSPSSAVISLTDNSGAIVGSVDETVLTINTGATSALFTILAANNALTLDYELRYVVVKFTYQSRDYYVRDYYNIRSNLRIPVSYDDVRNIAGLSSNILTDDQIDLFAAYSELQADVDVTLDSVIASGSSVIPHIQTAVAAKAALNALNFVETMIFQSEQADNTLYKRFTGIDFNAVLGRLQALYNAAIGKINGDVVGSQTTVNIFNVVTGTDPVTGE